MERLTSNKPTSDMNMLELAYNSCYADEKCKAKYRDYELDIDSRELVKNLVKDMCDEDLSDMSDEELAEWLTNMCDIERYEEPYKSIYNLDTGQEEEIHDSYGDLLNWLQSEAEEISVRS